MANNSKSSGIVYLVGAGPGHPDLITRLGYDLLQNCDAVAYDALIPMELISGLPERVEKYYVGKRAGKHSLPQSQINDLLLKLAKRGLKVVRLKGGDPFIFGRSGEEAEHLAAAGIPVAMIPGVTAASAAAAMSGFSLTNRQTSSWIFLATGHGAEYSSFPVPWDRVAALPGGTFVIYMGLAQLDRLIAELLSSGLTPETPAMVVQAASTGVQESVEAPLIELSIACNKKGLKPPALIIIGEAVRYKGALLKTSACALSRQRILVTSPAQAAVRLCKLLRQEGAEAIPYPTVFRKPVHDAEGWTYFQELVRDGGLCLFSGDLDIDCFFDDLIAQGLDARSLYRLKIIACGRSTETALLQRGIKSDQVFDPNDFTGLTNAFPKLGSSKTLRLILARSGFGDQQLKSDLSRLDSEFRELKISANTTARWEDHWRDELDANPPAWILFTDAAEVEGFFELLGDAAHALADKVRIAALDKFVTEALRRHHLSVEAQASIPALESLVQAIIEKPIT
jgi:uroporphyrinogen III methyltransferase/synthase